MKRFILIANLLVLAGLLFAQDQDDDAGDGEKKSRLPSFITTKGADVTTGFKKQRYFEIGFGFDFGASTTWFKLPELVQISSGGFNNHGGSFAIDKFIGREDLKIESALVSPVGIRLKVDSVMLDIGISTEFNTYLRTTGETLDSLKKLSDIDPSDPASVSVVSGLKGDITAAGSAFLAVVLGVETTLLNNKLWVRGAPSVFMPLFYMPKNNAGLEGNQSDDSKWLELTGSARTEVYMATQNKFPMGLDFSLEGLYAVWPVLDAGVSVRNIPLVPALMSEGAYLTFDVNFKLPTNITSAWSPDELLDVYKNISTDFDYSLGGVSKTKRKSVTRPTRLGFYGIIKPFRNRIIIIRPDVGFSLNTVIADSTFNWGIEGQINLPIILSLSAGIKLFEESWSNYAVLGLNFGIIEFDIGAALRGPTFASSWDMKGLGFIAAFKLGI